MAKNSFMPVQMILTIEKVYGKLCIPPLICLNSSKLSTRLENKQMLLLNLKLKDMSTINYSHLPEEICLLLSQAKSMKLFKKKLPIIPTLRVRLFVIFSTLLLTVLLLETDNLMSFCLEERYKCSFLKPSSFKVLRINS